MIYGVLTPKAQARPTLLFTYCITSFIQQKCTEYLLELEVKLTKASL